MVAKTPVKVAKMATALNPNILKETLAKVDKCMARLQELQYTVVGGTKVVSGIKLSPRSTRGYLRTSLRCKQETLRMKNTAVKKSPIGKFNGDMNGDWKRMSLPAMLLGETVVEILQASQFAKEAVTAAGKLPKIKATDPETPVTIRRSAKTLNENSDWQTRRKREKQARIRTLRNESPPIVTRARSRIRFKSTSPLNGKEEQVFSASRPSFTANRISPKNRPWAKKTVLFSNPVFHSSSTTTPPSSRKQRFYKTRSPIIGARKPLTPHKFVIKSPPTTLKSQMKSIKAVPAAATRSPSEKVVILKAQRCSFSPSKLVSRMMSPLKTRISQPDNVVLLKSRRGSFSPSKIVNRMMSPLKTRVSVQKKGSDLIPGVKQRPNFSTPVKIAPGRMI